MMTKILPACALLALAASTAHADTAEDLAANLSWYAGAAKYADETLGAADDTKTEADCLALIAKAKKAGLKDSDTLRDSSFRIVPKAKQVDEGHRTWFEIPVSDATAICSQFTQARERQKLRKTVQAAYAAGGTVESLKPEDSADVTGIANVMQACVGAIDGALAGGMAKTDELQLERETVTVAAARTRCEQLVGEASAFEASVSKIRKERAEKVAAKFKAAGIKGKRLELFAYWDQEWYLPGCESSTADPKRLKKAKKLFQWVIAPDGQITIRKYTFKGDNYSISEKTTYSEDKAYKLCR